MFGVEDDATAGLTGEQDGEVVDARCADREAEDDLGE